jgi:hypothetical protein
MAEYLIDKQDLHIFWSAFDPLDMAGDSVDVLGFGAAYVALADRILPGFTTITTIPRYLGMLSYALKLSRESVNDGDTTASARKLILEQVQLFERKWALACGLAEKNPRIGEKATNGLRGIRAVHRWLSLTSPKSRITLNFALLANQLRYGGIGAYSSMLEALHLVDMKSLHLRPLGERLADAFPLPFGSSPGLEQGEKISVSDLERWGSEAHLGALTSLEANCLRQALRGWEEVGVDDHARWAMLQLLKTVGIQRNIPEHILLRLCRSTLNDREISSKIDAVCPHTVNRIRCALRMIDPYEKLYQIVQFIFDYMRAAAAQTGTVALKQIAADEQVKNASAQAKATAMAFLKMLKSMESDENELGPAHSSLLNSGLMEFAESMCRTSNPILHCEEILKRHKNVQNGKFDGGIFKGAWIELHPKKANTATLTAQRYALEPSRIGNSWKGIPRHSYRTNGAKRFIQLCKIQGL